MSQDWLHQLAPAHPPASVGWWPLAPGWWILAAMTVLLSVAWIFWLRNPSRRLRQSALRQLRRLRASKADSTEVARAVQNLMRRYALQMFGYEAVANLTGQTWLEFVVSQGGRALSGAAGTSLLRAAYGDSNQDDRSQWLQAAERFIAKAGRKRFPMDFSLKHRAAKSGGPAR